jgi:hypothetical protein
MIQKSELEGSLHLVLLSKLQRVLLELIWMCCWQGWQSFCIEKWLAESLLSRESTVLEHIRKWWRIPRLPSSWQSTVLTVFLERGLYRSSSTSWGCFMHFKWSFAWYSNCLIQVLISRVCRQVVLSGWLLVFMVNTPKRPACCCSFLSLN